MNSQKKNVPVSMPEINKVKIGEKNFDMVFSKQITIKIKYVCIR